MSCVLDCTSDTMFYAHMHTHPFNGPLSGTTRVIRYQKGKTDLDSTEALVSGSGISWAVCKFAPRSKQTTTPAPHHCFYNPSIHTNYHPTQFFTGRMPFLPPNQQRQSTQGELLFYTQMHTTILDKVVHCSATLASVLHWKCHYWVTVAATGHRGPLTGTKSYCLVTDTQRNNLPDRLPLQFRMEK